MSEANLEMAEKATTGLTGFLRFLGIFPGQFISLSAAIVTTFVVANDPVCAHLLGVFGSIRESSLSTEGGGLLLSLVVGYVTWFYYQRIVGDLIVWPLYQNIHYLWDRARSNPAKGKLRSSSWGYLEELGVPSGRRRPAYLLLERFYLPRDLGVDVDPAHGQAQAAEMVGVILAIHVGLRLADHQTIAAVFREAILVVACFAMNFISDCRQHAREVQLLRGGIVVAGGAGSPDDFLRRCHIIP